MENNNEALPGKYEMLAQKIRGMPKYRGVGVPEATVRSLVKQGLASGADIKTTEKAARMKLHNIIAPYLGDLDYEKAAADFMAVKDDPEQLAIFCFDGLERHASTRERGRDIAGMYAALFGKLGETRSIYDLACGLHPLGLPFTGLPRETIYRAYDLHGPRAAFLDIFIKGIGYAGGCFHRDIYAEPPAEPADAAFFFKEAHRLEKREPGATVRLIDGVPVKKFVASLPISGMSGRRRLSGIYENMIVSYADKNGFDMDTMEYGNEVFYIIDKGNG